MKTTFIALGSNIGDRRQNLDRAVALLHELPSTTLVEVSSYLETAPVGYTEQADFLNAVAKLETSLSPTVLLKNLQEIERQMGRKRTIRWGPRVIDLDILLYANEIIDEAGLKIPHPRMMERRFVLEPLAEIAPYLMLPGGITAKEAALQVCSEEEAKR